MMSLHPTQEIIDRATVEVCMQRPEMDEMIQHVALGVKVHLNVLLIVGS
jgi:hypothetical protein